MQSSPLHLVLWEACLPQGAEICGQEFGGQSPHVQNFFYRPSVIDMYRFTPPRWGLQRRIMFRPRPYHFFYLGILA